MRKSLASVAAVALVGLAVALSRGQTPRAATPDEQAIRQAVADYAAALTNADMAKISAFWAPDAEYTDEAARPRILNGVKMGEGDGTVSLLSLGAMCVEGWKRPRWNPAGIEVTTVEVSLTPKSDARRF